MSNIALSSPIGHGPKLSPRSALRSIFILAPRGLTETKESLPGFRSACVHASLQHAQRALHLGLLRHCRVWRPSSRIGVGANGVIAATGKSKTPSGAGKIA